MHPRAACSALAIALFAGLPGCRTRATTSTHDAGAGKGGQEAGMPAALESSLSEIHERSLKLGVPAWPTQRLSFGRQRLLRLGAGECSSLSLDDFSEQRFALAAPRAVVELADGSLVVAGVSETLRVDPDAKEAAHFPRVPFLPGSELVAERRDPRKFWVLVRPTRTLLRYELAAGPAGLLRMDAVYELETFSGAAFTVLRDGALLYAGASALERRIAEGKPHAFAKLSAELPWRLLPGPRIDEAWSISADGKVTLYQVLERLRAAEQFEVGAAPFAAAASQSYLALLLLEEGGAARKFMLRVWTKDAKLVLEVPLPVMRAAPGDDWAERAMQREVALSEQRSYVAVLDAEQVSVWDLSDGRRLIPR